MKIEENMYIRTKRGIRKVEQIEDNKILVDKGCFFYYEYEIIGKPSYNIIDLIEEGDYVNGKKVIYIEDLEGSMREFNLEGENPEKDCGHWEEEIKSIVTHEQFKNMEYKP